MEIVSYICTLISLKNLIMKQETLEEAAERIVPERTLKTPFGSPYLITPARERKAFIKGAKWQAEIMYSKEQLLDQLNLLYSMKNSLVDTFTDDEDYITMKWFEQFKKQSK